jgi:predicted DCC family thiol-disulfide oxidoreductase YuxK
MREEPLPPAIVFYDGVCGFCNASVRFVAGRDRRARFQFASLQSGLAGEILRRHGCDVGALDTMYLLLDGGRPGERLLFNSDAILAVLDMLGGVWKAGRIIKALPHSWRDAAYRAIVRHRYRLFGKYDECPLPPEELRARFIVDVPAPCIERVAPDGGAVA